MVRQDFTEEDILITVKAYPNPSKRYIESSCTAGLTRDHEWLRIHPLPFRMLEDQQQFRKYQWIRARIKKSDDNRPESHKIDYDSIRVLNESLSAAQGWARRRSFLETVQRRSMEEIRREQELDNTSLGFFKPKLIERLTIEPSDPEWSTRQLACLSQQNFLAQDGSPQLEKIPFTFRYRFYCDDTRCNGHHCMIVDWEVLQSYRSWHTKYGTNAWEEKLRQRYESDMQERYDTHLFVGTMRARPQSWIIIGLFYPPKSQAIQSAFVL